MLHRPGIKICISPPSPCRIKILLLFSLLFLFSPSALFSFIVSPPFSCLPSTWRVLIRKSIFFLSVPFFPFNPHHRKKKMDKIEPAAAVQPQPADDLTGLEAGQKEVTPTTEAQAGVQKIEAVTLAWSRTSMFTALALYVTFHSHHRRKAHLLLLVCNKLQKKKD